MSKLSHKDKKEIIENKIKEIRDEFFATYKSTTNIPWHEHMTVTSNDKISIIKENYDDEIQREVQIYNITLENVRLALGYLTQENVPIQRPADFEVELFKSPKQMDKIKKKIQKKEQKQKSLELKKERSQGKKMGKMMKNKKLREEHKEKRSAKRAIEEWKEEIKAKGSENARDLNEFTKKRPQSKRQFNKPNNIKKKAPFKKNNRYANNKDKYKKGKGNKNQQFKKKVFKSKGKKFNKSQ